MKRFKQVFSAILAVIILCVSVPFVSADSVTPVILVSGFGATTLTLDGEPVFPPSLNAILKAIGLDENLTLEKALAELEIWLQDKGYVQQLSAIVSRMVEPIRMGDNGESVYDIKPIISGAENTSYADFKADGMLKYVPYTGSEFLDMESIANRIGDENVFNYMYDWRLDYNVVADDFKAYIDDVLEITGAKKVSVYAISQGALVVGQYLFKYSSLEQTDKIIFDTPVLGGSTFVSDLLTPGGTTLNFSVILALLSDILHIELDLRNETLLEFLEGDWFAGAINIGKEDVLIPPMKTCIAFWQMVPVHEFDERYPALLDENTNAAVIEAVKDFHNGFMGNITQTFENAAKHGSTVSIKACSGFDLVTPSDEYSDSIVDMAYSCGAICAPYGETFSEDYVQAVDNGKNSISPDRTIDLSAGYWPDRTWVVNGLFHGQVEWCKKSLGLVEELLYTDNIKDAYSSYEYPQFMESTSPTSDVHVSFVSTNNCFLLLDPEKDEHTMVVTNLSRSDSIVIKNISSDNNALSVDNQRSIKLLPGESAAVSVSAESVAHGKITVKYSSLSDLKKEMTRTFGYSVIDSYSGATSDAEYNEEFVIPFFLRYLIFKLKNVITKIFSV